MYEEKQKRLEMNGKAYQEWLDSTRNRQKPIPMNKGLQSKWVVKMCIVAKKKKTHCKIIHR